MHNTCGHTKRYTSKSMNETNNCVPDTVAHHVIFRACMWTPQSACHSNKSHHGTCTKIWRMAKPSFDHFQIKWSCPHYFGCSVFSPGWEVMHALGPNVCQELFQGGVGVGCGGDEMLTGLLEIKLRHQGRQGDEDLWSKLAWEVPWVTNFGKEKKNSFQGSFPTHYLLKYTVWNTVGSNLDLENVGGWIVLYIILGFVSSH